MVASTADASTNSCFWKRAREIAADMSRARLEPVLGALGERAHHQRLELGRNVARERRRRLDHARAHRLEQDRHR